MVSPLAERAVSDCIENDKALLKFISANDSNATGGHQTGFYLPSRVHQLFTIHPPIRGENKKHPVEITWEDGRKTESMVTWYGAAKSEYRLTRFGKDFPFLTPDLVGALFVLIPTSIDTFLAYVFDTDEDIEYVQTSLGTEVVDVWGVYDGSNPSIESDEDCLLRLFRKFAAEISEFPTGKIFSAYVWDSLIECVKNFERKPPDDQLLKVVREEYELFRLAERKICEPLIHRMFPDVDTFLKTASSIMNRRKSRAGRSLENHIERIFSSTNIPFEMRPADVDGNPDLLIPNAEAYHNQNFPKEKIFVVGIKTTCKDRWRQVLNEGKRIPRKHLITVQQGISSNQLDEMAASNVQLVVPKKLHKLYPKQTTMDLFDVSDLISKVSDVYG